MQLFAANDACKLPLEVGKGVEQLQRWYFDRKQQMCHQFIYRGLYGNANNFITQDTCQQNCERLKFHKFMTKFCFIKIFIFFDPSLSLVHHY